jgi:glycosyltransferase involved in cell wall biosynthesis
MIFDLCIICMLDSKYDARVLNLGAALSENGFKVAIISFGDKQTEAELNKLNIAFFPVDIQISQPVWKLWLKFHNYITNHYSQFKSGIFLAGDFYSLLSAVTLGRNNKVIYDSREIYSALGSLENKKIKQFVISKIEKYYIKKIDSIIVSGEFDAKYLKKHLRNDCEYHLIMNLPQYKEPVSSDKIRAKFNINKNVKIALYQGMIMKGRGLIPTVTALKDMGNICMCIIGSGGFENELRTEIQRLELTDRVFFTGNIPYNELHEWSCSADVGLCLFEPVTLSYRLALPNKLFEYALANLPVVATDLPAISHVLQEFGFGETVHESLLPKDISVKISKVLEPSKREIYIENSKRASKHYCYESQIELILRIFK